MSARSDRGDFENAYLSVIRALRVLAASPEEACELQGHYNVAYEVKLEAEAAPYIFDLPACTLTNEHKQALLGIVAALQSIPQEVLAFTSIKEESLEKMKHSSWKVPRGMARLLVDALKPTTDINSWYFEQDRSKW
ncbi:hypothetical protein [Dokdonella soli]|uniref:XRE family transcriptional regulator n=1 Tax=Dokdonella soli TaxID=529810 RepID=A0ABN1ISQ2_9GAMM